MMIWKILTNALDVDIRLKSLISYGLLQSGNIVTDLGYNLAYPETIEDEERLKSKAVLNVSLWRELYEQIKKNPPDDFWIPLRQAAKTDAPTAQKHEKLIKKWYMEDIAYVSDNLALTKENQQADILQKPSQSNKMSQQSIISDAPSNAVGRVMFIDGSGFIDVVNEATLELARSYIAVFEKKLQEKKKPDVIIIDDDLNVKKELEEDIENLK